MSSSRSKKKNKKHHKRTKLAHTLEHLHAELEQVLAAALEGSLNAKDREKVGELAAVCRAIEHAAAPALPAVPVARADVHALSRAEIAKHKTLGHLRSATEIRLRKELATAYNVFAMLGWEHSIHTHITCKVPSASDDEPDFFLINPYGLNFDEVNAGNLVTVRLNGEILDSGSADMGINPAGFAIHRAIHASSRGQAGGDIQWTMHTHHSATVAVGCTPLGVLPLSTFANDLGAVAYHDYAHTAGPSGDVVCQRLVEDLGSDAKVLMLRNHGDITVGASVGEAYYLMDNLHKACDVQVKAQAMIPDPSMLVRPEKEVLLENAKVIRADYTGERFGGKEWKAIVRRLEQRRGRAHLKPYQEDGPAGMTG